MTERIQKIQAMEMLHRQHTGKSESQLRKSCAEFESLLLYEIVKGMRRTISKCDLFHGGQGEEMYEQFLDQELCRSLSSDRGLGLGETLYQQLRRVFDHAERK